MNRAWGWCWDCHRLRTVLFTIAVRAVWLNDMPIGVCAPCWAARVGHPVAG